MQSNWWKRTDYYPYRTLDTTQKMKFFSKSAVTKSTFTDKILNGNFVFCAVRESEQIYDSDFRHRVAIPIKNMLDHFLYFHFQLSREIFFSKDS